MSAKDYKYFSLECIEHSHEYYNIKFMSRRDLLDHTLRLLIRALCDSGDMKVFDEFNAELIPILFNKFRDENKYKPLHKDSNIYKPISVRSAVSFLLTGSRYKLILIDEDGFYQLIN